MAKLVVTLTDQEFSALMNLAVSEMRDMRSQAHLLIRQGLGKRGLLLELDSEMNTERKAENTSHE